MIGRAETKLIIKVPMGDKTGRMAKFILDTMSENGFSIAEAEETLRRAYSIVESDIRNIVKGGSVAHFTSSLIPHPEPIGGNFEED